MTRAPGSRTRLRVYENHGPVPEPGDFLRTDRGTCYLIDEVRQARPGSKSWGTFFCTRLDRDAVQFGDPGVSHWVWGPPPYPDLERRVV